MKTIAFEENSFRSLYPVAGLKDYFLHVNNLSFARNEISSLKSLDVLSKLDELRELVFIGNPVADLAKQRHTEEQYRE